MITVRIRKFEDKYRLYIVNEDNNEYIIDNISFEKMDNAIDYCDLNEFRIVGEEFNPMEII